LVGGGGRADDGDGDLRIAIERSRADVEVDRARAREKERERERQRERQRDRDLQRALELSRIQTEAGGRAVRDSEGFGRGDDCDIQKAREISRAESAGAGRRRGRGPGAEDCLALQDVFLFVSRTSGGNLGQRYLDVRSREGNVSFPGLATVWIFDILEETRVPDGGFERAIGAAERRAACGEGPLVRVIACGGDGTVSWTVSHMRKRIGELYSSLPDPGVEREGETARDRVLGAMVFGVLPLGTGNDFSRTFRWGGSPPRDLTHANAGPLGFGGLPEEQITRLSLEKSVRLWLAAGETLHDLWMVEVSTCAGGDLFFASGAEEVAVSGSADLQLRHHVRVCGNSKAAGRGADRGGDGVAGEGATVLTMKKPLLNYFSFGYESKVGMEFDKRRTSNANMNKLVYGVHGLWEAGKAHLGKGARDDVTYVYDDVTYVYDDVT